MALTIKGIRVTNFEVVRNNEGADIIKANYQLVASNDKVLATETLTTAKGYGEHQFTPSPQTIKAITDAIAMYKNDVETSLGLETA